MKHIHRHRNYLNIFLLDEDPIKCSAYYCDIHVCKMLLEMTYLLSTVIRLDLKINMGYMPSLIYHPCTIWTKSSAFNWVWIFRLAIGLAIQYRLRYNREHKCESILLGFKKVIESNTPVPGSDSCMLDFLRKVMKLSNSKIIEKIKTYGSTSFKNLNGISGDAIYLEDPVEAHRYFYLTYKKKLAKWKVPSTIPYWWSEEYENNLVSKIKANLEKLHKNYINTRVDSENLYTDTYNEMSIRSINGNTGTLLSNIVVPSTATTTTTDSVFSYNY